MLPYQASEDPTSAISSNPRMEFLLLKVHLTPSKNVILSMACGLPMNNHVMMTAPNWSFKVIIVHRALSILAPFVKFIGTNNHQPHPSHLRTSSTSLSPPRPVSLLDFGKLHPFFPPTHHCHHNTSNRREHLHFVPPLS